MGPGTGRSHSGRLSGCIVGRSAARMHDSDVWVLRWREMNPDGSWIRRKSVIGTVKAHPSRAAAFKAGEFLRSTINRETRPPRTMAELVDHSGKNELPNKTPYTQEVYTGFITQWITPKWGTSALSDIKTVAVESWLGTLKLANGTRAKIRNIMSALYSHAMRLEFFDRNPIISPWSDSLRSETGHRMS